MSGRLDPETLRSKVFSATIECLGTHGFAGLTMESVAQEAGVGRATIYRRVAATRGELVRCALTWEIAQFLDALRPLDDPSDAPAARLEGLVVGAVQAIDSHNVFQSLLADEPAELTRELGGVGALVLELLTVEFTNELSRLELQSSAVSVDEAGEYLARMVLSYVGSPGRLDLHDRDQVHSLVQTELLGWMKGLLKNSLR